MIGGNDFAFAHARMQARLGLRLAETDWHGLRAQVEFRSFLEQARTTALAGWLGTIAPGADAHEVERSLRGQLRDHVEEVARWLPGRWRASVRWTTRLVDLPAVAHLLGGGEAPSWMHEDAELAPLLDTLAGAPRLPPGGDSAPAAPPLLEQWLAGWRARLPRLATPEARRLDALVGLTRRHLQAFAAEADGDPGSGSRLRADFERSLVGHFRRAFMEPAAVFAFLLLVALDFERLRGALASRALFQAGAK